MNYKKIANFLEKNYKENHKKANYARMIIEKKKGRYSIIYNANKTKDRFLDLKNKEIITLDELLENNIEYMMQDSEKDRENFAKKIFNRIDSDKYLILYKSSNYDIAVITNNKRSDVASTTLCFDFTTLKDYKQIIIDRTFIFDNIDSVTNIDKEYIKRAKEFFK